MQHDIAVIIPAYKGKFLKKTLDSIAAQECKDFTLYIGDDCSPEDLEGIVKPYTGSISIKYRRFSSNLGKKDLLAHWDRCIRMSCEHYIMFFSDDDIMPSDAICRAREYIARYPDHSFFRFNLCNINEMSETTHTNPDFPGPVSSAEELLCDKLGCRRSSAAIEYVFTRDLYDSVGGFVRFPLAWCSDDATWYLMAKENGVVNISGRPFMWRNAEGCNISNSSGYNHDKIEAVVMFLGWLGSNYTGLRTKTFRKSICTYLETILNVSLGRDYSKYDLYRICREAYRLTGPAAMKIFFNNIL